MMRRLIRRVLSAAELALASEAVVIAASLGSRLTASAELWKALLGLAILIVGGAVAFALCIVSAFTWQNA